MLSQVKKALISGGAGTGKTMLAFEKCRQLALQGYRTLYTCPNRLLAESLSTQAKDIDNLTVINFHRLCYIWGIEAGFTTLVDPDGPEQSKLSQEYFDRELPETLLKSIERVPTRFDAIIVDEGQDMRPEWWEYLQLCMEDIDEGVFYIFYDKNQTIWYRDSQLPFKIEPLTLTKNLRNSKKLHQMIQSFYSCHDYESGGPDGGRVFFVEIEDSESLDYKLEETLNSLIRENITLSDVAILTGKSKRDSSLFNKKNLGRFKLTEDLRSPDNHVLFSSIRRFRGLEKPVIIIIELEELLEPEALYRAIENRISLPKQDQIKQIAQETLYIGLSRAQGFLYIVAPTKTLDAVKKQAEPAGNTK